MAEQPTGLTATLQLMQQLQQGAQKDVDSAIHAQGNAGSKLNQAMSQSVNRRFRNPGQTGMQVLGGPNQTGIQNQALMAMGLGMLEGGYSGGVGTGLSKGIQQGMQTLNTLRDNQKQSNINSAKTGYEVAGNQLKASQDRRDHVMASQGGMGGLLTNQSLPSSVREGMAVGLMNDDEKANYLAAKRASQMVDMGGGVMGRVNPITGELEPVTLPGQTRDAFRKEFAEAESTLGRKAAYAEASGKGQAGMDVAFEQAMTNELPQIQAFYSELKELRDKIADGTISNTGFFEGRFMKYVDGETAVLNAAGIEAAIGILSEAGLQPVSDREFGEILAVVAGALNDPEANLALIDRQIRKLEEGLSTTASKARYFRENNGTLKNWALVEFEEKQRRIEGKASEAQQRDSATPEPTSTSQPSGEVDLSGII